MQSGYSEDFESANEDSDEDEIDSDAAIQAKPKKFVATLPNFAAWYENQYSSASSKKSLIIILEDFEGFSSQMLQDLISNLT